MKKKLFALLPVVFMVGCGSQQVVSTYYYTNPQEPQGDYGPEIENSVVLDGYANESFYDNEHVYRIDNREGEDNYSEVRFGFGEKGFLAYAYVYENKIFENSERHIYYQDSFELYINPGVYTDVLRSNCVQFRLSPLLRTETWIGMHSPIDDYPWTYYTVPFRYGTHVDGKVITNEAEEYDDSFAHSQGVGYEFYIPYSSFGLDYNPQGLDILPAMVTAHSTGEADHVWSSYNSVDITDLKNYITIGNRVFKPQGNNVFDTDRTSSGFVLDHQSDETYPYVKNFGHGDQYAYFNTFGDMYYAKTRITLYHPLLNDPAPKVGIGSINSNGTSVMLLDPRPAKDNYECLVVDRIGDQNWKWSEAPISWAGAESYDEPITLEVVRYHNNITYFMRGIKLFELNANALGNANSYPILMTMGYSALFDKCSVTTNEEDILNKLNMTNPYLDNTLSTNGFVYDADDDSLIQNGRTDQFGVFKISSTHHTMSVDITFGERINDDQWPKIGIGEMGTDVLCTYLFDPLPNKSQFSFINVFGNANPNNRDWSWPGTAIDWVGEKTYSRVINLKIVREGTTTKLYMDNTLTYTCNNRFGDSPSHPMLMTMNHTGTFSNISVVDDAQ